LPAPLEVRGARDRPDVRPPTGTRRRRARARSRRRRLVL